MPLKITVELIPRGDEKSKRKIGELFIVNDGSGTQELGNYKFRLEETPVEGGFRIQHCGEYKNHKRRNGCWSLIGEILKSDETVGSS